MSITNPKTEMTDPNCSKITDQPGLFYSVKEIDLTLANTVYGRK